MLACAPPLVFLCVIKLFNLPLVISSSQNATQPRSTESDYYSQYEDIPTDPPGPSPTSSDDTENNHCDYDMCVEQELSCQDLAIATNCLCPGLSESHALPSPPDHVTVSESNGKLVMVNWCAPTSLVNYYMITIKGNDESIKRVQAESKKRAAVLEGVKAGMQVCVDAVNYAGFSEQSSQSCAKYEPLHSDSGLALKLGLIGGVVGLTVLLILILLLWRHKGRRKSAARTATERGRDQIL